MPNWCEGNIRLRGTGAAILEFLKNEIMFVGYDGSLLNPVECAPRIEDDGCEVTVSIPETARGWHMKSAYVNGTHRNFIDEKSFYVYLGDDEERAEVITVCIDNFKAAWGIVSEPYVEKARKYGIDIKIVGFEKGMQFAQIIEIVDGELIKDQEINFDDWDWECLMPNMGG